MVLLEDEELIGEWHNPFHNKHPSPVWVSLILIRINSDCILKKKKVVLLHNMKKVEKKLCKKCYAKKMKKVVLVTKYVTSTTFFFFRIESCTLRASQPF